MEDLRIEAQMACRKSLNSSAGQFVLVNRMGLHLDVCMPFISLQAPSVGEFQALDSRNSDTTRKKEARTTR